MTNQDKTSITRALTITSVLLALFGVVSFLSLSVNCYVYWAYAATLLTAAGLIQGKHLQPRLGVGLGLLLVALSLMSPWPYWRFNEREVTLDTRIEKHDLSKAKYAVLLVADGKQVEAVTGYQEGFSNRLEWLICSKNIQHRLETLNDKGSLTTTWQLTFKSTYLSSWDFYSYNLLEINGTKPSDYTCAEVQ